MKFIGNFNLRLIINLDAVMGIRVSLMTLRSGGGREIRTLGRLLTYAGFQDRCIKPLCHPSSAAYTNHFVRENKAKYIKFFQLRDFRTVLLRIRLE